MLHVAPWSSDTITMNSSSRSVLSFGIPPARERSTTSKLSNKLSSTFLLKSITGEINQLYCVLVEVVEEVVALLLVVYVYTASLSVLQALVAVADASDSSASPRNTTSAAVDIERPHPAGRVVLRLLKSSLKRILELVKKEYELVQSDSSPASASQICLSL